MDSDNDSDSNYNDEVPAEIKQEAKMISLDSLSQKSKIEYVKEYNSFKAWRKTKNTSSFDEALFIVYFNDLAKKLSSATLWAKYSKLKATINQFNNIDIGNYKQLLGFLKKNHKNYVPKKANTLSANDITKFCNEAPNNQYLDVKIILALGIFGACRTCELVSLKYSDVEDLTTMLLIKIPGIKTPVERSFTIDGTMYQLCKMYMDLRPVNVPHDRFLLNFQMGKCTRQPIGRHKISKMPSLIAKYLGLPNPKTFTGHTFRRTSATLLVDGGGDILDLKRHGGWQSDKVAEGYVADSIRNKKKIAQQITADLHFGTSTSRSTIPAASSTEKSSSDGPPPCKRKKSSTVSIMKTTNDTHIVQNEGLCLMDRTDIVSTEKVEPNAINPNDLNVPNDYFDDDEFDSHTINVMSNNDKKIPFFQFEKCNVTINIMHEKKN